MGGASAEFYFKPEHPDLVGEDGGAEWLGNQNGLGIIPGSQTGNRAIAAALFLYHRLDCQRCA